jgi:uncharacterized repeat protein (TIGR03843 family)
VTADELDALAKGELVTQGRIMPASNATFLAEVDGVKAVYKPIRGERPLWDFPDGTLAYRERAAFLVSEATGWDIVPPTILRDGPYGEGMVQIWRDPDPEDAAVTLVPAGQVPADWCHVFDGFDAQDREISLIHEDSDELRRMAVFDILVNNADRKGGHVLEMADGHRHGVDHGVTFHVEPKLRTVLWGWAGTPLRAEEVDGVRRVLSALEGELRDQLEYLLTGVEIDAVVNRANRLLQRSRLPEPRGDWPAIPWPPF